MRAYWYYQILTVLRGDESAGCVQWYAALGGRKNLLNLL